MPNAIALLSKYFWAVGTCGGSPKSESFAKRYELHYQPKKVYVGDKMLNAQFGCLNFHAKRYKDSEVKLTLEVKNKWSSGWMNVWFYCKVPIHRSPHDGKSIHPLRFHMGALNYLMEPTVNCPDLDSNDAAFV
jgi:hypothetical protein